MRRPCGDQLGCTASPCLVSGRISPPDAGTTHSCALVVTRLQGFCPSPSEKTILEPSGDQAGSKPKSESRFTDSPVEPITKMPPPPRSERKAMRSPSGGNAGAGGGGGGGGGRVLGLGAA